MRNSFIVLCFLGCASIHAAMMADVVGDPHSRRYPDVNCEVSVKGYRPEILGYSTFLRDLFVSAWHVQYSAHVEDQAACAAIGRLYLPLMDNHLHPMLVSNANEGFTPSGNVHTEDIYIHKVKYTFWTGPSQVVTKYSN